MSELPYAKSFRELIVYQKSVALAQLVFEISTDFPRDETYSLTDQIRRSSRSVGSQIAESWAKRSYPKHFTSKLTDADGEQLETQHWIQVAFDCSYIDASTRDKVDGLCLEIGKMLGSMIRKAEGFSGTGANRLNEDVTPYLTRTDFSPEV